MPVDNMPMDRLTNFSVNGQLNKGGIEEIEQIHRLLLAWTWQTAESHSLRSRLQPRLPATQMGLLTTEASAWRLAGPAEPTVLIHDEISLITQLAKLNFDAVLIFTQPTQSPYAIAYCCYLAGIPIRVGQSSEFGGTVLSLAIQPLIQPLSEPVSVSAHGTQLLESVGLLP